MDGKDRVQLWRQSENDQAAAAIRDQLIAAGVDGADEALSFVVDSYRAMIKNAQSTHIGVELGLMKVILSLAIIGIESMRNAEAAV